MSINQFRYSKDFRKIARNYLVVKNSSDFVDYLDETTWIITTKHGKPIKLNYYPSKMYITFLKDGQEIVFELNKRF